jgi:hypothetical protein
LLKHPFSALLPPKQPKNPNSYDEHNHKRLPPRPEGSVPPAILVQAGGRFFYATAARLLALKFILSMSVRIFVAVPLFSCIAWAV